MNRLQDGSRSSTPGGRDGPVTSPWKIIQPKETRSLVTPDTKTTTLLLDHKDQPGVSPTQSSKDPFSELVGLTSQELAEYIESKMKEQYLEQTRTLEQLQVKMHQQLLQKQAQLMEQIQRLDAFKLDNSKAESQPLSTSNDLMEDQAEPSQPNGTDCLEVADSSANHTTGYDDTTAHDNSVGKLQSATLNAEESLSGNVSQSSSHDTWDSTNAFTRERPVLTGSERSTPTPVLVTRNDDTELVSQSIHIPCDKRSVDGVEMELSPPVNLVPASNDDTLFKKTSSHMSNLVDQPNLNSQMESFEHDGRPISPAEVVSDDSIPPESPGDELSQSLRLSLRQKHSRHLADLRAYYETEMSDLKERLTSSTSITQHESYIVLKNESKKLRERCRVLEEELLRANRYINTVDKQMEDLESSFNANLSNTNDESENDEVLALKNKLSQCQIYNETLGRKNQELFSALCNAYEVRDSSAKAVSQNNSQYQELRLKYEALTDTHQETLTNLHTTESLLMNARQEIDHWKRTVHRLEATHANLVDGKVTHENPSLMNSLYSQLDDMQTISPLLKAERESHLGKSCISCSPEQWKLSHDKTWNKSIQPYTTTNDSDKLNRSPQLYSDTQSSDNSKDMTKQRKKHSHHRRDTSATNAANQSISKDNLVSAYSPVVDRQRHSSSASSGGPVPTRSVMSPSKHSLEHPFGYHHVGASVSPSKRTQQWAVLSPFNRSSEIRDKPKSPNSAKKNLASALSSDSRTSAHGKICASKTFAGHEDKPVKESKSTKNTLDAQEERLRIIHDAETQLDELLLEKRQLESALSRVSSLHGRQERQKQESLERQLDRIDKDLGSVRMTLRRYNIL